MAPGRTRHRSFEKFSWFVFIPREGQSLAQVKHKSQVTLLIYGHVHILYILIIHFCLKSNTHPVRWNLREGLMVPDFGLSFWRKTFRSSSHQQVWTFNYFSFVWKKILLFVIVYSFSPRVILQIALKHSHSTHHDCCYYCSITRRSGLLVRVLLVVLILMILYWLYSSEVFVASWMSRKGANGAIWWAAAEWKWKRWRERRRDWVREHLFLYSVSLSQCRKIDSHYYSVSLHDKQPHRGNKGAFDWFLEPPNKDHCCFFFFGLINPECKNRDVSRRENKHLKLITYKNSHENTMQEVFDFYKEKNLLKRSLKQ